MSIEEDAVEHLRAGDPLAPPVVSVDMFGRTYPLMHGAGTFVGTEPGGYVLLGIGHHEMNAGMFMGLSADSARAVATWLLASADELDGGPSRQ